MKYFWYTEIFLSVSIAHQWFFTTKFMKRRRQFNKCTTDNKKKGNTLKHTSSKFYRLWFLRRKNVAFLMRSAGQRCLVSSGCKRPLLLSEQWSIILASRTKKNFFERRSNTKTCKEISVNKVITVQLYTFVRWLNGIGDMCDLEIYYASSWNEICLVSNGYVWKCSVNVPRGNIHELDTNLCPVDKHVTKTKFKTPLRSEFPFWYLFKNATAKKSIPGDTWTRCL